MSSWRQINFLYYYVAYDQRVMVTRFMRCTSHPFDEFEVTARSTTAFQRGDSPVLKCSVELRQNLGVSSLSAGVLADSDVN